MMNNIVHKIVSKVHSQLDMLLSGALILGLFQFPFVLPQGAPVTERAEILSEEANASQLTDIFFGAEANNKATAQMIEKKMEFVSTRGAFPASLSVIQKHENTIKKLARQNGVPEDVAIGVGLLENGGSETAKSPAGALGVFQLMPGTARSLGLTVTKKIDERRNPVKNIDAGMRYLKMNYDRFGDWGLSTWAYHAGEGNVSKALKLYAKEKHGITLVGLKDASQMRDYVQKHGITIHKLLSSPAVKNMTKKLNDDSSGYPYKVIATATLFKQASLGSSVVPGQIVDNS